MVKQTSTRSGASSSGETIETPQDMQSLKEERKSNTSDMLGSTPPKNQSFQAGVNSEVDTPISLGRLIQTFAKKLKKRVEWRKIELLDKRTGWVLFFDDNKWELGEGNELVPKR